MSADTPVCSYCGSTCLVLGRDGFLTCSDCGTVLEEQPEPKPGYGELSNGWPHLSLSEERGRAAQEALRAYEYLVKRGFRDQAYCVVPLVFVFAKKPAEAASLLGMPEELATYAVLSFLDGVPLNMAYGPKVFMPLRRLELPPQLKMVRLRLRSENGSLFVEHNGRVPIRPLYAGTLALKNHTLRHTISELLAVKTRSGTVLCADVGCIPRELPIKKRFYGLLR